jgi:hypothetical protein
MPSVSKAQQKLFGIIHGIQTGRLNPKKFGKDALTLARKLSPSDVRKYATTRVTGLPTKLREMLSSSPYSSPMPDFPPASDDKTPKISNDPKRIAKQSKGYDSTRPRLTKID